MIAPLFRIDQRLVYLAIFASALISLWANIVDDVVNHDAIEYIKSAQNMLDGHWHEAVQTYKWPFYAALMALVATITQLPLVISAQLIDAAAFIWISLAFIALIRLLGGGRAELWIGLLIILAFPTLNKFRPYIIRDPAFLAFFLSACYYYFAYFLDYKKRFNALAILLFGASALFRVEGLIFLVMSQVYLMVAGADRKAAPWVATLITLGLIAAMVVLLSWWNFMPDGELTYLSILHEPIHFLETVWGQLLEQINRRFDAIQSRVLVGYSESYALVVLMWSAVTIVFFELMHALYYLYFGLFIVATRRGKIFGQARLIKPWRFILMIAIAILLGFVMVQWFLSDRYPLAAALLMLLPAPFLLVKWRRAIKLGASGSKSKKAATAVMVLIVLIGIKSLDLATKKTYLKQAGQWLNTHLEQGATLHTNDRIVAHYFGRDAHVREYWSAWRTYKISALLARDKHDYLAFNIKPKDEKYAIHVPKLMRKAPVAIFENEKGAKVLIFEMDKKRNPEP